MNTTKLDTTTNILSNNTLGDLIDWIQDAMNDDYSNVVAVHHSGTFWTYPHDEIPYGAVEVIDVYEQQCQTNEPVTAESLAEMALELLDDAIYKLARRLARSLYIPSDDIHDRDIDTEYVAVIYNESFGVPFVTVTSDLTDLTVLAVLAEPGEKVRQSPLWERLDKARDNITLQIADYIRGNN